MTDRHVLITGGAGYIGSILTSELLRANYRVTVLDSLLFGGESIVPFLNHPNFHFIKADVTEARAVRDAVKRDWQKPDSIVHLAAIVGFPACQAVGKQVAWKYNVEATKNVFGQASDLGVERFVFASTYSNYGLSTDGQPVLTHRKQDSRDRARTPKGSSPVGVSAARGGRKKAVVVPSVPGNSDRVGGSAAVQAAASPRMSMVNWSTTVPVFLMVTVHVATAPGRTSMVFSDSVTRAPMAASVRVDRGPAPA